MRVRYELYKSGYGQGVKVECDLSKRQAKKLYKELSKNVICGWAELVAEEPNEGEYMEIVHSFDNINRAIAYSKLADSFKKLSI